MTTPAKPGRRAALRTEALATIKSAALEEVRRVGAADVSLRAVAREAGISPAGLYRYFDGRDALLTALIADVFTRLAGAMEAATADAEADPASRLTAAMRAYRGWGVAQPHEFGLVFGNPVPGYAAPPEGETTVAMREVSRILFTPLIELWAAGDLVVPTPFRRTSWTPPVQGLAAEISGLVGAELPTEVAGYLLAVWSRLHGIVSLEVFGQLHWVYPDGAAQLFEAEIATLIDLTVRQP